MSQSQCTLTNGTILQIPYFLNRTDENAMNSELFDDLLVYTNSSISSLKEAPGWNLLPDGTVDFALLDLETGSISYTLAMNNDPNIYYHRPNNVTRLGLPDLNQTLVQEVETITLVPLWGQLRMMDMIHYSLLESSLNQSMLNVFPSRLVWGMPYNATQDVVGLSFPPSFFLSFCKQTSYLTFLLLKAGHC
jgi:hypothetical protein